MTASSSTTAPTILAQEEMGRLFSRPQPWLSPASARPTALTGRRILRSAVFNATIARLLGQRRNLAYDLARRGAAASHNAIAARTAINAPSRMSGSSGIVVDLNQRFN